MVASFYGISFHGVPVVKLCKEDREAVADLCLGAESITLCARCSDLVHGGIGEHAVEWTVDQEAWKLEALVDGPYRLAKKSIADVSESTGTVVVTEDDLDDLVKVLAAKDRLDAQ